MFTIDKSTKEFSNVPYPVGITPDNVITGVDMGETDHGIRFIDIFFENPEGYSMRHRIFELGNIPEWSTEDKEKAKLLAGIKHILNRFVPVEALVIQADTFSELGVAVKTLLEKYAVATAKPFSLLTLWDKNFTFSVPRSYPPFMATEDDKPLAYTEKELKRNFPQDVDTETAGITDDVSDAPSKF